MKSVSERFVPFTVDRLALALPLGRVERVVPAVEVAALPDAPRAVLGVINIGGRVVPVFDLRRRFGLPEKELLPENKMIIAAASRRTVALVADEVGGVVEAVPGQKAAPADVLPGLAHVEGILKTDDGMLMIHDIDGFLTLEEQDELAAALTARGEDA